MSGKAIVFRVPAHVAARIEALVERAGWASRDGTTNLVEAAARKLLKAAVDEAELDVGLWLE